MTDTITPADLLQSIDRQVADHEEQSCRARPCPRQALWRAVMEMSCPHAPFMFCSPCRVYLDTMYATDRGHWECKLCGGNLGQMTGWIPVAGS